MRHCGPIIIVALLLGHAGIAVHAAVHIVADNGDCKICTTHGQTPAAVDESRDLPFDACLAEEPVETGNAPWMPVIILPFHSRGPPQVA